MSTNVDNNDGLYDDSLGDVYNEAAGLMLVVKPEVHVDELCGLVYASSGETYREDEMEDMMEELVRHNFVSREQSETVPQYNTEWFDVRDHVRIMDEYDLTSTDTDH